MYEELSAKCEAMREELSSEIKELSGMIAELAKQHKNNLKEIELHHNLCSVSNALAKAIGTIDVYFKE